MRTALQRRQHRQTGFSLIEVIVVLAVLVVVIALVVPSAVQRLTAARRTGTLNEMENLKVGMMGDASLKIKGVRSDFAYLGDMGNLPATLDDLVTQGAQPAYDFDSSKQVGAGWKGPYVTVGGDSSSHKRDAFGNDYTYDTTDYTNGQGQAVDGKMVTFGADGIAGGTGENEDVTLEMLKVETTASVNGFVFDQSGSPVASEDISINHPANGVLTFSTATTDSAGFYQFTNIPFGMRSVTLELEPRLGLVPGSVTAIGTGNRHVRFRVVNFSRSPVTVRSIVASYDTAAFYNRVRWGSPPTVVWLCSGLPKASGDTTVISPDQTVAAGPGLSPFRVPVAASTVQVTDITVQGNGTEATVHLQRFRDDGAACNSGSFVNMSGTNFTDVQLLDPSSAIVGQFSFTVP